MDKIKGKIESILAKRKYCSIATSDGKNVNNAMVEYYSEELSLFFGSLDSTLKCRHISANPQVAVCIDALQIHGLAKLLGKDTEIYREYAKKFLKKFPRDRQYFEMADMNFFKIEPLVIWCYDLSGTYPYQRDKVVIDGDYYKSINSFENPDGFKKVEVSWL